MLRLSTLYKEKKSGKYFAEFTALNSGNGIETEISQGLAKELIKEFGLIEEHTESSIYYELPE